MQPVFRDAAGQEWDFDYSRVVCTRRSDGMEKTFGDFMWQHGFRGEDGKPYVHAWYEEK